jgi:hypothetical protein
MELDAWPIDKWTVFCGLVVAYVPLQLWWWGSKWRFARQEKRRREFR